MLRRRRIRGLLSARLVAPFAAACCPAVAAQSQPAVTNVFAAPPSASSGFSIPIAISADGSVVAGFVDAGDKRSIAYRWSATQGEVELPPPPGVFSAFVVAVSPDGDRILGIDDTRKNLFVWNEKGAVQPIPLTLSANATIGAAGWSADGETIVGAYWPDQSDSWQAYRYSAADGLMLLAPPQSNIAYSEARGVSADGSVIVGDMFTDATRAFRWTADAGIVPLAVLSGFDSGYATAVSSDGAVIAGYCSNDHESAAVIWTSPADVRRISPPGIGSSVARAIDATGQRIVGVYTASSGHGAFFWDAVVGFRDLRQSLATDYVLDVRGLTMADATAISADGRTIAGVLWRDPARFGDAAGWWSFASFLGTPRVRGDLNCDGFVNNFDIDAFILASHDPAGYATAYPECGDYLLDMNADGQINRADEAAFVTAILGF